MKIIPIEYVRGSGAYRSIIADTVEELRDDVFYLCTDSPDNDDEIYIMDLEDFPVGEVQVFNAESNLVETRKMIVAGDFAYEVEEE